MAENLDAKIARLRAAQDQLEAAMREWAEREPVDPVAAAVEHARHLGVPVVRGYVDEGQRCIVLEVARPAGFG